MADEPMSDERLAEIRASIANINERGRYSGAVSPSEVIYASDASLLLAEVDRLRAREAVAMAIVRDVANLGKRPWANQDFIANFSEWCAWCGATHPDEHTNDCPVTKARALLAEE